MKRRFEVVLMSAALAFAVSACGEGAKDGGASFDASKSVSVIAREDGSGTKSAFMEIIGLKGKADPASVIIQTGTAGVLAEVKGNSGAIAYESLGYVTDDVKTLKVDGAEATVENIKNGSYKISRPLSVVFKESALDDGLNGAFYDFLKSSAAQTVISNEGYVSIVDGASEYTIDASLSGTVDISGSTSLQPLMIKLAAEFEDIQPNVTVNVSGGGSGTGYNDADGGITDFGMISEEFNVEKAPSCSHYVVAKDGIAVIVHKDNPLDNIALEQLNALYDEEAGDAAITKWSELIN
ncbi:MAG: substrate-binding domain-containing protein [Oscillospiraceae bacterium]|jgi:phosphate transport system substrate-binding protein|nr:substrate-binding domain-containing protein [Oscillospiraceae bacterium]